jgi:hypothetical protein
MIWVTSYFTTKIVGWGDEEQRTAANSIDAGLTPRHQDAKTGNANPH